MNIIRAYELKVGDLFRKMGYTYRVTSIMFGKIYFKAESNLCNKNSDSQIMGVNSQERVELVKRGKIIC